jgi:stage V sporulation protein SpoVS
MLRIDRCRISGMGAQGVLITSGSVVITHGYISDNGHDGVWAFGVVDVVVEDTTSVHNLSGAAFFNGARGVLRDSVFSSNQFYGVYASAGPTATPTTVRADNVTLSYNTAQGFRLVGLSAAFGSMTITRSTVVGNAANGFWADGASGPIAATISDSTFSNQAVGYAAIVAGDAAKLVVSRNVVVDNGSFGLVQYDGDLRVVATTSSATTTGAGCRRRARSPRSAASSRAKPASERSALAPPFVFSHNARGSSLPRRLPRGIATGSCRTGRETASTGATVS